MKKIIALVTVAMLTITMIPYTAFAESGTDTDTWDGTLDFEWYKSATPGTTSFTISTAEELAGLADIVNGTADGLPADTFEDKTVTLTNNLDLASKGWTPIGVHEGGNNFKPFLGIFDGENHSISNMKIDRDTPLAGGNWS